MSQQTINVGAAPNDGTGTPLRTAFQYCNSNFSELYTATGPSGNNITVPGNATITGDLTVDTSTLKVDSANNRVGIGTASPSYPLHVASAANSSAFVTSTATTTALLLDNTHANGWGSNLAIYTGGVAAGYFGTTGSLLGSTSQSLAVWATSGNGINFFTNGNSTARATLDSSGNLGIGVTPSYKLHVVRSTDGSTAGFAGQSYGIRFDNGGTFSTGGSTIHGVDQTLTGSYQQLTLSGSLLLFSTSGTERARFNGTGAFVLAGGTTTANGIGITFPSTQAASSDANTLDDYEEGTWTGTLTGGTTNPTTPVTATGRYTKIGRVVTVQISFSNVNTTGASGLIGVTGLPFANNGSVGTNGSVSLYLIATFTGSPFASIGVNESFINLYANNSGGAFTDVTHNAGASKYLTASVTYTVD